MSRLEKRYSGNSWVPDPLSAESEVHQDFHKAFLSPTNEAYILTPDNDSNKNEGDQWLKIFWKTY